MDAVARAVQLSESGCSCSQSVFGAFAPRFGLDEETAIRIASGFGGGMRMGDTCGAVTGAFMALGLALAGDASRTAEGRQAVSDAVVEFARRFRERNGALSCRDLLGCDIHTPEGKQSATDRNLFETRCRDLVRDAAAILHGMLPADPGD
jgi:C_GCAxxG_C_C family probable redox protein